MGAPMMSMGQKSLEVAGAAIDLGAKNAARYLRDRMNSSAFGFGGATIFMKFRGFPRRDATALKMLSHDVEKMGRSITLLVGIKLRDANSEK